MKNLSLFLTSLLMQMAVCSTAYAQRDGAYAFDEGYGVRSALNYLPEGLTGKGVLVGVIDRGIVFNHISFLDPNTLQTRIKHACYFNGGVKYEARTPEAIAAITLPAQNQKEHGTHVAGIAAGSYAAEGWLGIAPESDLCLAEEDGHDHTIRKSLESLFAAADSLDMPLIVNMSVGSFESYNGYTDMTLLCEKLTENGTRPGRIITVASGNSGKELAFSKCKLNAEGKARLAIDLSLFNNMDDLGGQTILVFEFEALQTSELDLRFFLYDKETKTEVSSMIIDHRHEPYDFTNIKDYIFTHDIENSPYRKYTFEPNPVEIDANILPCVEITGPAGAVIGSIDGLIGLDGDDSFSTVEKIYGKPNSFALTPAVISVGNYDSHYEGTPLMPSSSFGTNKYGEKIPDVVAPGCGIISGTRFYDPDDEYKRYGQREVTMPDGSTQTFNWRTMTGTSQSAPLVAGLCALMLQYDPTLTVNRVRELLHSTNDWNEYCDNAPMGPDQAGHGILNTRALFEALMGGTSIDAINDAPVESPLYDLYGNRLKQAPAQGFYIGNGGKKVFGVSSHRPAR